MSLFRTHLWLPFSRLLGLIFLVFALAIFSSCKKDAAASLSFPKIDSVKSTYFIKSTWSYTPGYYLSARAKFEYSDGVVIKRSGSHPYAYLGLDYSKITDLHYDTVEYISPEEIIIKNHDKSLPVAYSSYMWVIKLEGNKPKSRISYSKYQNTFKAIDTTYYFHDAEGNLVREERHNTVEPYSYVYIKNFLYSNGNLEKITGIYKQKPDSLYRTSEETFSMYDNKPNPLKGFWLWDDLLYRSLSKNNFAKYTYQMHDGTGNLLFANSKTCFFEYDSNGNVIY